MIIQILQETDLETRIWVQADYWRSVGSGGEGSLGNTDGEVEDDKEKESSQ